MTRIATWNVNSVKARLPNVLEWLKLATPDVVCLQEIKTVDEGFPALEIEDLGYNVAVHGQKSYNGVAILSKIPFAEVKRGLPGDETDEQARYIEAELDNGLRVASIYLPNGNPVNTEKFPYKLAWMDRLIAHAKDLLDTEQPFVLAGDYNVIPHDIDVWDPKAFAGDALTRPETRDRFRALLALGLTEAFRAQHPEAGQYSYWDYQGGAWPKGFGIRIDHLLLSPQAADMLRTSGIDKRPRGQEKASDHTPVWIKLGD